MNEIILKPEYIPNLLHTIEKMEETHRTNTIKRRITDPKITSSIMMVLAEWDEMKSRQGRAINGR